MGAFPHKYGRYVELHQCEYSWGVVTCVTFVSEYAGASPQRRAIRPAPIPCAAETIQPFHGRSGPYDGAVSHPDDFPRRRRKQQRMDFDELDRCARWCTRAWNEPANGNRTRSSGAIATRT